MRDQKKWISRVALTLLVAGLAVILAVGAACKAQVTTQELQGLLQAIDGKDLVITLEDGTSVRVRVEKSADDATKALVGEDVRLKVETGDDNPKLVEIQKAPARAAAEVPGVQVAPENQHASGVIESMSADTVVIAGKTLKINVATTLDQGLAKGVAANVEFITLSDGSLLATEIETQTPHELEGRLQAVDGKDAVITLDDGNKVRVEVEKSADDMNDMIGGDVRVRIKAGEDKPKAEIEKSPASEAGALPGVQMAPEDMHFSGAIESMGADAMKISGKTFKVNAATILDQGLAVGVAAEVEFIMLSDGSMLATEIETPAADDAAAEAADAPEVAENFAHMGVIQSLTAGQVVMGNKTLKIDANTILDNGLAAGVLARAEFVVQPDGSLLALEIETDAPEAVELEQEDFSASGPIASLQADQVVVDGRSFKIDASTILDSGLAPGVLVKVEFVLQPDGTMRATEVETAGIDEGVNLYFSGAIESMGAGAWVIGGKTFKVGPATFIDNALALGVVVSVEFVVQPDGSLMAVAIEDTGFEFTGMLQATSPGAYTIGGRIFQVGAATLIERGLKVRKQVRVDFTIQPDGSLLALEIRQAKTKVLGFSTKGVVQSLSATSLVASGQTFQVNATTVIAAGVNVGIEADIRFDVQPGGILVALSVERAGIAKK